MRYVIVDELQQFGQLQARPCDARELSYDPLVMA